MHCIVNTNNNNNNSGMCGTILQHLFSFNAAHLLRVKQKIVVTMYEKQRQLQQSLV